MRAQISSSWSRGAVAPVISVRPVLTMSAARESAPGPKRRLLHAHALELVLGHAAQHLPGALGDRRHDDEVAQPLEQVLDETARVVARLDDLVDLAEGRGAVAGRQRVDGAVEQLAVGEAEQRHGAVVGQALGTRAGDELVEHRQRVTHRAAAGTRDEAEHARLGRDVLGLEQPLHVAS